MSTSPRREFLALAEKCGAVLTGKPDGSESVSVVFTPTAWRAFDAAVALEATPAPIDMVLHCPKCGMQHIDCPEPRYTDNGQDDTVWDNPPHRSHLCKGCGHIWRPADVPTNGVSGVKTAGKNDSSVGEV